MKSCSFLQFKNFEREQRMDYSERSCSLQRFTNIYKTAVTEVSQIESNFTKISEFLLCPNQGYNHLFAKTHLA